MLGVNLMEVEIGVTPAAGESRIGEGLPLRSEADHLSIDRLRRACVSEALSAERQIRERFGILGSKLRRLLELGASRFEVLRAEEPGSFGARSGSIADWRAGSHGPGERYGPRHQRGDDPKDTELGLMAEAHRGLRL